MSLKNHGKFILQSLYLILVMHISDQNINEIDPKEQRILNELNKITDDMSSISLFIKIIDVKENIDGNISFMKNWLFVLTIISLVVLYFSTFLRRKLFENEMEIMRINARLDGHTKHFANENSRMKNITKELQKEIKRQVILQEVDSEETDTGNGEQHESSINNKNDKEKDNSKEKEKEFVYEINPTLKDIYKTVTSIADSLDEDDNLESLWSKIKNTLNLN